SDCINSCVFLLKSKALQRSLTIGSKIDGSVPKIAIGDAARIRQILLNLVNNALKFTLEGSIEIIATAEPQSDRFVTLTVTVTDTGIGVDADKMDRLFKPFSQVDATISHRFGGSGLGLAICKNLVELMGGSIHVRSKLNQGSEFWFEIPLEIAHDSLLELEAGPGSEAEARRRAIDGVVKLKFHNGQLIKIPLVQDGKPVCDEAGAVVMVPYTEHAYSDVLLIFLMKGAQPEKYRERFDHRGNIDVQHDRKVTVYIPDNNRGGDPKITVIEDGDRYGNAKRIGQNGDGNGQQNGNGDLN
ncbi:MAG: hypothetical protein IID45_12760, partial [Planctomycetes bacterium]|nr:hypothetical protein [Planctomycetota bacterium]